MRWFDRWIWVVVVGYVLSQALGEFWSDQPDFRVDEAGETLTLPRSLPEVTLEGPGHRRGGTYIGTAFAVGDSDDWLTARHVTDGCRSLGLRTYAEGQFGAERAVDGNVLHRSADLARLDARHPDRGTFPVLNREQAELPYTAFGHGFPQGQSAYVPVRLLGDIAVDDPRSGKAVGAVWHVDRYPDLPVARDLGGLSGGPLMTSEGVVRGIVVGSDPRRGRLVTIDPIHAASLSDADVDGSYRLLAQIPPGERDRLFKASGMIRLVDCRS